MKLVRFIILLFFFCLKMEAQPLPTHAVEINAIFDRNGELCFTSTNGIIFNLFVKKEENCKNIYYDKLLLNVNSENILVYKKDTMYITLLFDKYSPISPFIKKLYFTKGNFIIDLKACSKEKGFVINNFPCNCMAYKKGNEK